MVQESNEIPRIGRANTWLTGLGLSLLFLLLCCLYWDFVMDDAFITYRYSKHLAQHKGLTWNESEKPVEGYTSFLWVVLNAVVIKAGGDPVLFSKIFSILSAVAIIWVLICTVLPMDFALGLVFVGAVALSPQFAFLTMQGMETSFFALLLLLLASFSLRAVKCPRVSTIFCLYVFALLSFLARPDSAPFIAGIIIGIVATLRQRNDYKGIRQCVLVGILFALVVSGYWTWRTIYFGHFFPNTFYVKVAHHEHMIFKKSGILYCLDFLKRFLLPYAVLITLLSKKSLTKDTLLGLLPVLLGCLCFVVYLTTVTPIQGALWRFAFPIVPSFFLAVSQVNNKPAAVLTKKKWVSFLLILFFSAWTLRFIPETLYTKNLGTSYDRIKVGKKLAGLRGSMFVSESGAIPYYSDWKSLDLFGLTSDEISMKGLSLELLDDLRPDLIVLRVEGRFSIPEKGNGSVLGEYMKMNDFVAVAAIHKSFNQYHLYFVRRGSELFDELAQRLTNIENIRYGNLRDLVADKGFRLWIDNSVQ